MQLFGQFPCCLNIIEQTNVGSPRHVLDCLHEGRIVHELVKFLRDIVMLELLAFRSVVRDVACDIELGFKADCPIKFHQPHSAIEIEEEQLT